MDKEKVFEKRGEVWHVSGHRDTDIDLTSATPTQSCVICDSHKVKVIMPKKVVALALIACTEIEVTIETLISSLELANCQGVKVRVAGHLPSVAIDKCQKVGFWITKDNASSIMFLSSKSGDVNVNINKNTGGKPEEDDWVEQPIPEQFEHTIDKDLKVITKPSSLYG